MPHDYPALHRTSAHGHFHNCGRYLLSRIAPQPYHKNYPALHRTSSHGPFHNCGREGLPRIAPHFTSHHHPALHRTSPPSSERPLGRWARGGWPCETPTTSPQPSKPARPQCLCSPAPASSSPSKKCTAFQRSQDHAGRRNNQKEIEE